MALVLFGGYRYQLTQYRSRGSLITPILILALLLATVPSPLWPLCFHSECVMCLVWLVDAHKHWSYFKPRPFCCQTTSLPTVALMTILFTGQFFIRSRSNSKVKKSATPKPGRDIGGGAKLGYWQLDGPGQIHLNALQRPTAKNRKSNFRLFPQKIQFNFLVLWNNSRSFKAGIKCAAAPNAKHHRRWVFPRLQPRTEAPSNQNMACPDRAKSLRRFRCHSRMSWQQTGLKRILFERTRPRAHYMAENDKQQILCGTVTPEGLIDLCFPYLPSLKYFGPTPKASCFK